MTTTSPRVLINESMYACGKNKKHRTAVAREVTVRVLHNDILVINKVKVAGLPNLHKNVTTCIASNQKTE